MLSSRKKRVEKSSIKFVVRPFLGLSVVFGPSTHHHRPDHSRHDPSFPCVITLYLPPPSPPPPPLTSPIPYSRQPEAVSHLCLVWRFLSGPRVRRNSGRPSSRHSRTPRWRRRSGTRTATPGNGKESRVGKGIG